jgi:hypothetical protein
MNKSFAEVAAFVRLSPPTSSLPHNIQVTRLYRHSLKLMASWVIDRREIIQRTKEIKARFDEYSSEASGSPLARYALQQGQEEVRRNIHPGGSKFMRNPPPPPSAVYQGHVPKEALTGTNTPVYPDMVPITFRPKHVAALVDFYKKSYE